MKKAYIIGCAAIAAVALGSCSEEKFSPSGEGRVFLAANVNTDVKVFSRATEEAELGESCIIWLSNEKGVIYKYQGVDNLPVEGINLVSGAYTVEAWAGEASPASFDKRWFEGKESFELLPSQTQRVTVTCRIANVVTSVAYDESIDEVLTDYTMTVSHSKGELTFEGRDERKGYFRMPPSDTALEWTLRGTQADGSQYVATGTIEDVKQAYEYVLTVKHNPSVDNSGGVYFTIEVDESAVEINDNIVIALAPEITGYNFDITKPLVGEKGSLGRRSVFVRATSELKSVVIEAEGLAGMLGINGDNFDLFNCAEQVAAAIEAAGITHDHTYNTEAQTSLLKINFEELFTNRLENGVHDITITATDNAGKTSSAVLSFNISDAPVATDDILATDITTSSAVLRGSVLKDGVESVGFNYRQAGTAEWTYVDGVADSRSWAAGATFSATVTGLTQNTTYEHTVVSGDYVSGDIRSFTTEALPQLPNAGMEDWWLDGKVWRMEAQGDTRFWDSGNNGSATMSKTVTYYDESLFHSGSRSAYLESKFVGIGSFVGKFAAGNIFAGQYIGTEHTTNGIIGFGRPFTGTPKALKVWVKYTPGTVDYWESGVYDDIVKGKTDRGIIYIALMDDHTETFTFEGKDYNFPVIVRTYTKELFDSSSEHVIAYGEKLFTEATAGDGLIELTIPLDYRRQDVKPSYIVLTASASKGGDFFSGSSSSKMWLDDFELVY